MNRAEFDNLGIYFLKGDHTDEAFNERVYIGEAENIRARLKQHLSNPFCEVFRLRRCECWSLTSTSRKS